MGITLSTFGPLLAQLQAVFGLFARQAPQPRRSGPTHAAVARTAAARPCLRKPVRVVRVVVEGRQATPGAGRMRISGRMADVCAELDRLAELEAAAGRSRAQALAPAR